MELEESYDFDGILVNEAEKLVIRELGKQLEPYSKGPICLCEDCVMDMAAMALNAVKPLYRVSLLGTMYASRAMDEADYAKSVRAAVGEAIEKVRKNPSHD